MNRSTAPRNADALMEVCGLARAAQDCPNTAGGPPHLTVTIDWDALRTGLGVATLDYGTLISAAELGGGRVTRRSFLLFWVGNPSPSTSAGLCGPFHCPSAERSWPETAGALSRAATGHQECARRTIVGTGLMMANPVPTIASCCVKRTIGTCIIEFIPPAIIDPARAPLRNPLRC